MEVATVNPKTASRLFNIFIAPIILRVYTVFLFHPNGCKWDAKGEANDPTRRFSTVNQFDKMRKNLGVFDTVSRKRGLIKSWNDGSFRVALIFSIGELPTWEG